MSLIFIPLFINNVTVNNNFKMKRMENCRKLNLIVVVSKEIEMKRTYGSLTTLISSIST